MKKEYTKPEVNCLGSVENLTQTNTTNNLSDVPIGDPLQLGYSS
jgi:hypothetical protein